MTQTSASRRVATVSGGALLLCLSFGGSAFAASAPAGSSPDPVGSVVGTVVGAVPTPTPIPTPSALDVVGTTVNQVTQVAGTVLPSSAPTTAPQPVPSGGKAGTTTTRHAPAPQVAPAPRAHRVLGISHTRASAPTMSPAVTFGLGGLGAGAVPMAAAPVTSPVVAPQQQTAVLAAGQTPALAPAPDAMLPGGDGRTPRGLFIALATMVIGGLAAGHVKVIQDRLSSVTAG